MPSRVQGRGSVGGGVRPNEQEQERRTTWPSCVPKMRATSPLISPLLARASESSPSGESDAEWMSVGK